MKARYFGVLLILPFCLIACVPEQPTMFGMPQDQWQMLTTTQKQAVIDGYNDRKRIEEENKPMTDAIRAAKHVADRAVVDKNSDDLWHQHDMDHAW